jgi:hypothetical protein
VVIFFSFLLFSYFFSKFQIGFKFDFLNLHSNFNEQTEEISMNAKSIILFIYLFIILLK